ncbi:anti-sigma factor RsiW [Litoreibacter ponti]|uniref:Anti-sigma factor RsiW n=1 Tax=Litoreibacter ponti TaxID=1510457 RepID=A0A2T6BNC0_9RHOB|nr:anti-sigma factor [Litoreibacter ponti]PTX57534.1 anti-sigma factor RsiW [Litoreibacter ponti]
MSFDETKLSAFLDGELPDAEAREIEAALETDPALQAQLQALMEADAVAQGAFAEMLTDPVPAALAQAIHDAPVGAVANTPAPPSGRAWLVAASVVLALGLGGVSGFMAGYNQGTSRGVELAAAAPPAWLADIADYHRVYAGQTRHLVEVGADEADHIETWLSKTVGAPVRIADLRSHGLTFEGGRLLVAAGKPVAQLMYTDAQGGVVALCLLQSDSPADGFTTRQIGDFEMVSWGGDTANFVVVGDAGRADLEAIAQTAAIDV